MSFDWIHENPPHWDAGKRSVVGGAPEGIFDLGSPEDGALIPGEWWRVEEGGEVVGYGWMDCTWGDAEILLAVGEDRRGRGVGTFILDRLEDEAASRGLNYMYNVVRSTHPDHDVVASWLQSRGFVKAHDTERLMRRVHPRA